MLREFIELSDCRKSFFEFERKENIRNFFYPFFYYMVMSLSEFEVELELEIYLLGLTYSVLDDEALAISIEASLKLIFLGKNNWVLYVKYINHNLNPTNNL